MSLYRIWWPRSRFGKDSQVRQEGQLGAKWKINELNGPDFWSDEGIHPGSFQGIHPRLYKRQPVIVIIIIIDVGFLKQQTKGIDKWYPFISLWIPVFPSVSISEFPYHRWYRAGLLSQLSSYIWQKLELWLCSHVLIITIYVYHGNIESLCDCADMIDSDWPN